MIDDAERLLRTLRASVSELRRLGPVPAGNPAVGGSDPDLGSELKRLRTALEAPDPTLARLTLGGGA